MIFGGCRQCGSSDRFWVHPSELAARVHASARADAMDAVHFFASASNAEAWVCRSCDAFGIVQVGSFVEVF